MRLIKMIYTCEDEVVHKTLVRRYEKLATVRFMRGRDRSKKVKVR